MIALTMNLFSLLCTILFDLGNYASAMFVINIVPRVFLEVKRFINKTQFTKWLNGLKFMFKHEIYIHFYLT